MKVLLINKYHYIKGGADTVFFHTKELLEEHGHKVIPFTMKHSQNFHSEYEDFFIDAPEIRDLPVIKKIRAVKRFIWNLDAARNLENLILEEKPDIAHLHNIFNAHSLSILPVLKAYNIPVVITLHDTRFICPSSYFNLRGVLCDKCLKYGGVSCGLHRCFQDNFLYSWMCAFEMFHKEKFFNYNKYIDKYIFVSNRYWDFHALRHSYFREKGIVLYNFLPDISKITSNTEKGHYLFYYGRITSEKGVKTLVEAMKELPEYTLKMAGTGPLLDKFRKQGLRNVEMLGFQSGESLWNYLSNASFVVVPSEWEENNPLTIIEAYAYGKPVIGANIGGIPEIIKEGETGYVFNAFDKDDLKAKIVKATTISDDRYMTLSMNARHFAEHNFDAESHYNNLLQIYKSVISK